MLRFGRVKSTNAANHTALVVFPERDAGADEDPESFDLPVLVTRQGDYSLPAKDAQVACLMEPGPEGLGVVLGVVYPEEGAPDGESSRVVAGDDVRLGSVDAADKVALAPATKAEIQKALDYANGIATAIQGGVVVAQDGGASLKATIVALLPVLPTLDEPAAENVSAK